MSDAREPRNENDGFQELINELEGGLAKTELSQSLRGLIADVRLHGKKGTLTLKVAFAPKNNSPQILIKYDIKVDSPKPDREMTILYADDKHRLSRRDPRQLTLTGLAEVRPLRAAEAQPVNQSTGEVKE